MTVPDKVRHAALVKNSFFDQARPRLLRLAGRFSPSPQIIVEEAAAAFEQMLPTLAYVDKPWHPLAPALFICSVNLALFLALRQHGVDPHDFGNALLTGLLQAPIPLTGVNEHTLEEQLAQFMAAAQTSQTEALPGEDVFAVVAPQNQDFAWGYNVTSCAICQLAARHDAMELVPYFCAVDDVMSQKQNQGLRRTGSLALGASHCDFRYQPEGAPLPLAHQYPNRIRWQVSFQPQASPSEKK